VQVSLGGCLLLFINKKVHNKEHIINNLTIEERAINVIRSGFTPQNHKNLLTWSTLTALFIISSAAAFSLGYQQSTNASKNNIHLIQSYAEMEKAIIDNYEKELYEKELDTLTIRKSVNPKSVKHLRYYDKNGLLVSVN
jgi:hypothetical protein